MYAWLWSWDLVYISFKCIHALCTFVLSVTRKINSRQVMGVNWEYWNYVIKGLLFGKKHKYIPTITTECIIGLLIRMLFREGQHFLVSSFVTWVGGGGGGGWLGVVGVVGVVEWRVVGGGGGGGVEGARHWPWANRIVIQYGSCSQDPYIMSH